VSEAVFVGADALVTPTDLTIALDECAPLRGLASAVRVSFSTRTRLKHADDFVRRPGFHVLFRRPLGRRSSPARFHCGAPLDVDFRGLIAQARGATIGVGGYRLERPGEGSEGAA